MAGLGFKAIAYNSDSTHDKSSIFKESVETEQEHHNDVQKNKEK